MCNVHGMAQLGLVGQAKGSLKVYILNLFFTNCAKYYIIWEKFIERKLVQKQVNCFDYYQTQLNTERQWTFISHFVIVLIFKISCLNNWNDFQFRIFFVQCDQKLFISGERQREKKGKSKTKGVERSTLLDDEDFL